MSVLSISLTNGQRLKGVVQNLYSTRKTCTVGGRQSILYVLKTDYNFLLTYICTNVGTDAFPQTKGLSQNMSENNFQIFSIGLQNFSVFWAEGRPSLKAI